MLGYIVKTNIKHDGVHYKKGDFIGSDILDELSAKRLLFLHAIEKSYVNEGEQSVANNENDFSLKDAEETVEETLDLNFDPAELKAGAKEQGLEFANNISKKNLIALIVENDKQQYFLNQLEDE